MVKGRIRNSVGRNRSSCVGGGHSGGGGGSGRGGSGSGGGG